MNLRDLHDAARAALEETPNRAQLQRAAGMALHMAEMVGWAPGLIDPRGDVNQALDEIRSASRARFEADPNPGLATLHDALADLMDAIARHDRDLDPCGQRDDDLVAI